MRIILLLAFLCSSAVFLTASKIAGTAPKEPIALLLDEVIDGKTFVSGGNTIRLWGIKVPKQDQPYFLASKLYLETILNEAPFSCHYKNKDLNQRYIMRCFSQGKDIASMLVLMGVATDLSEESKGSYLGDQRQAEEQNHGIWSSNL